ncbi:MAG: PIG-L family deacetylase [Cyclobacteriaceae bacterium]
MTKIRRNFPGPASPATRGTRWFLVFLLLPITLAYSTAQENPIRVIVFCGHPDDCDSMAGGTAILFSKAGHKVKFVSLTNGDAGHQTMGGGALAKRREAEAHEAGRRFGVEYTVIANHDGELMPTLENRLRVIREIRNWNADIVIAPRPEEYHPDHRYTSILVQDASYMVIVPNIAPDTPPLQQNPVFLYSSSSAPDITIDIDDVRDQKIYAQSAHESQYFEWLPWTNGQLDKVPKDKKERLEWFAKRQRDPVSDAERVDLKKWYGEEHAAKVNHAESFQFSRYGRRIGAEEIRRLFPMLNGRN